MNSQDKSCIFCKIISKDEPSDILYEDAEFLAIKDIYPAARFHALVLTKKHIPNAKNLKAKDEEMVQNMERIANELLTKEDYNWKESRLGFHWAPFCMIYHLHLHVISPINDLSFVKRIYFKKDSFWFRTSEEIKKQLSQMKTNELKDKSNKFTSN